MSRQTAWDLVLQTIKDSSATHDEKLAILNALSEYLLSQSNS